MKDWTPKTRDEAVKNLIELEKMRAKWHDEQKTAKKPAKGEPKTPKVKGEPGEAAKTLKKVSALKGAKQNAHDAV